MKYSLLILALSLGVLAAPPLASADDRDRDYHYGDYRDHRDGVHRLRDHYDRVKAESEQFGASRHQRDALHGIRDDIDRVSGEVDSGRFDPDRVRGRITRIHEALHNLSDDLRHNDRHSGFTIQIR
jgi:hypothetical protein